MTKYKLPLSHLLWLNVLNLLLCSSSACSANNTADYLKQLERDNSITYQQIVNTRGAYVPSMCYTKTKRQDSSVSNPCYVCHTRGTEPNFTNDTELQYELNFPKVLQTNPYKNLFVDHSKEVNKISNTTILNYVRHSNYHQGEHIKLASDLPEDWPGYRPDCYFNFDAQGFDRNPQGEPTLWRAFRYYPFPGSFWPTNGSTDDVLIRLGADFAHNKNGQLDLAIYSLNLAIVESLIKRANVTLAKSIDETLYQQDLNKDGVLSYSAQITFPPTQYVGAAATLQNQGKVHLAVGLYPEQTEFLHSVRYLDWNETSQTVQMAPRMKELRYARKYQWKNYAELKELSDREFFEAQTSVHTAPPIELFKGSSLRGLRTPKGWIYQGFIENKHGELRPQTREETIACMGCHSGLGVTTDSSFAFPRKLASGHNQQNWQHWSQQGLKGIKEPIINIQNYPENEYAYYLQQNHSANELRNNPEVINTFFDSNGQLKAQQLLRLKNDISVLLLPSFKRAMRLNKAYKVTVENQSFIYGREGTIKPQHNVHKKTKPEQKTGIQESD
ncbi:MAG: hypothetical protein ACWA5R_14210 [bacterium]